MKKHILITGGTGYLGSFIAKELLFQDYQVTILKRATSSLVRLESFVEKINFIEENTLDIFFQNNTIDGIIHIATSYGRKGEKVSDILNTNLLLPTKLFELAIQNKVGFFINTDTSLPANLNAYSLSKAQFKEWLKIVPNEIKIINVIPEYFYGPGDEKSKFISGILHQLKSNVEFIDFTEGIQKRDFIYIDDVVAAFICLVKNIDKLESYSDVPLGSSRSISLKEVVILLKKLANNSITKLNFGAIPMRKGDVLESKADISYLNNLGWQPKTTIEQGITKIIETEY